MASFEILHAACVRDGLQDETRLEASPKAADFQCSLAIRRKDGSEEQFGARAATADEAVAAVISHCCRRPIEIRSKRVTRDEAMTQVVVAVGEAGVEDGLAGVGRFVDAGSDEDFGSLIAALRAASHAGLLKADYRANNQKVFREWSAELCADLCEILEVDQLDELRRLEAEGAILEQVNRVASAAVVTAANYPRPESVLSLFDTSAWLFDSQGGRRDAYTDTNLWLAWYPGIENGHLSVDEVIESMPKSPPSKIPFVVKLFENPESWLRFRGAVDLEDHDVMHVLLGRGLQDQDEAFVIGFAMGTAKRISWFQYYVFKWVLARLYPEPFRIPKFLQPAFELGVQCGKETGVKNLYKQDLKKLRGLSLAEARKVAGIDMNVLRRYYEIEQQKIPFTIASLRLP